MSLQTTLCEESREQPEAKVAESKEVQSRLKMREDEIIMMYGAQTKRAAEREQLRLQTAKKTSTSLKVKSAARDSERSFKRAKIV